MLRDLGSDDKAFYISETPPHPRARLDVPPPEITIGLAPVLVALWLDLREAIRERCLVERCFSLGHFPAEIDDPFVGRATRHIHAVHPWPEHVGVGAAVRIE